MGNKQRKDSDLFLEGFRRNDENILSEFYQIVFPKVRVYVLNNSGDESSAKDVFQEAFIACWRNIKEQKFNWRGNLEAYLFTIAKNKWTDHLRSSDFRKTVHKEVHNWIDQENEEDLAIQGENEHKIINRALQQLGKECRNLLALFYFERKSMEEIAEELEIAAASARNKKYRCMEKLRVLSKEIKKNGY